MYQDDDNDVHVDDENDVLMDDWNEYRCEQLEILRDEMMTSNCSFIDNGDHQYPCDSCSSTGTTVCECDNCKRVVCPKCFNRDLWICIDCNKAEDV
jgi:hypothetical protein